MDDLERAVGEKCAKFLNAGKNVVLASEVATIIAGLVKPTGGEVQVAIAGGLTGGMSMMFQTPALLDWRSVRK